MLADTIVAIATPPGEGGVGVIRFSGPDSVGIASTFFRALDGIGLGMQPPRLMSFGRWLEAGKAVDEVLCVRFEAPHTFTGEPVVEVHAHGGAFHLQSMLKAILQAGARLARPGEFTERAFLNGRMDLTRAEAVADLIHSGAELSRAAAARQLAGGLFEAVEDLRKAVLDLSAQAEAAVDFPEEEDQLMPRKKLLEAVRGARKGMGAMLDTAREGRMVTQGIRVVIAGSPNAGKSSLLNALLGRERSIVTPVAGTTRDYIEEKVSLGGFPVLLTDTAGIRDAQDRVEAEGVKRSRERLESADILLMLLDGSRPLTQGDLEAESLTKVDVLAVANKKDLGGAWDLGAYSGRAARPPLQISCVTGEGLENLKSAILDLALKGRGAALLDSAQLTQARHEDAMRRAEENLGHVEATLSNGKLSAEFLSGDLRACLDALGEIVGKTPREDVLRQIFDKFCIGK